MTVKGAVPVATFEVNVLATTAPAVFRLPALALPVTANEVRVPTLVILGCAAVTTVPAVVALPLNAPTKVVAVIELFDRLAMRPVLVSSAIFPDAAFAKIRKLFPVPATALTKSATFACATFKFATRVVDVTVNGAVPVATFEIKVLAVMLPAVAKLPDVVVPVTPSEVSVPTEVIFGCAAVVTVPAVVALVAAPLNAPTNVVAVIELFDKLAVRPVLVNSVILPVAAFAKRRKLFPVPAATLMKSATFA